MISKRGIDYREAGVMTNRDMALASTLLKRVRDTERFRENAGSGQSALEVGYFANVVRLSGDLGLAMTTDGVGTKVLIAQMLGRYETIGIDCVAMNVNDIICVGAEPMSMLDYIAIEKATPEVLDAIGRGLHEGARQAGINIVGGEISQMAEVIRGANEGTGLDLIGMCVGLVKLSEITVGQDVRPGDVIIGLRSSGIHSNGLTLARKALFDRGGFDAHSYVAELGRTAGEELLAPTRIYVPEVMELLNARIPIKALVNITGDGFFNLTRIRPSVSFELRDLPQPQPIFKVIQEAGGVPDSEMYRVFNMGIGFCIIAPQDPAIVSDIHSVIRSHGGESYEIGRVFEDDRRLVNITDKNLRGENEAFLEVGGKKSAAP
jgi:phosphoribosylformylglycinamidine cyclo-ligase